MLIIIALIFNLAFYAAIAFYFLKSYRKTAQNITRKVTTKVKESLERSRSSKQSKSKNSSNSDSSSNSDAEKSKRSVDVRELEEIMDGIQVDSKRGNHDDDSRKNSVSSISGIPSETDDSPTLDKRMALGLGDSGNQSSIVRNFGLKQLSYLQHQNSFNNSQSLNNSGVNLLAPNLINSAMSSSRRINNLSLHIENNVSQFLRPRPISELSNDGKQIEALDSPNAQRQFNLGISYEDSPRGGMSRIHHQGSYQDDSLILKIPYSPSEIRSGNESEEVSNKELKRENSS